MPFRINRQLLSTDKLPSKNKVVFDKNNYVQESITFGDQHAVESAPQQRDYMQELINKINTSEKEMILINIGSCYRDNVTYQEFPPFLNTMEKDSFSIFNIDPRYSDSTNDRYPVTFDASITRAIQTALANGKKIILFDNTSQTGLNKTHQFAQDNLAQIGSNLEIIIGYGTHGDQMIPILHPRKKFFEQHRDTTKEIGELAALYCDGCQSLHRTAKRIEWMRNRQLIIKNESCTQESWGTFLVSKAKGQKFVRAKTEEKGIEVYFDLDHLEHIPLFKGNSNELTTEERRKTVLANIIDTLIRNIETQRNGRYTSRNSEWKSQLLTTIKTQLQEQKVFDHSTENKYLSRIRNICAQKRNIFHFWAEPHSAAEFDQLLHTEKWQRQGAPST